MTPPEGERRRQPGAPKGSGGARSQSARTGQGGKARGRTAERNGERPGERTGQAKDRTRLVPEARQAVARGRGRPAETPEAAKGWGGVARRGARTITGEPAPGSAQGQWRATVRKERPADRGGDRDRGRPPAWEPEVWVEEPDAAPEAQPSGGSKALPQVRAKANPPARRPRRIPRHVADELERSDRRLAPRLEGRLGEAIRAYERDRYQDARRILRPLAESAPDAPAVRELYGLTLYRMNRWAEALKELQAFHALSGSYDQYPVMADCFRALRRWKAAEQTWDQLREASPSAEVVAEGRIVMAGALADRGRLAEAIRLLERPGAAVKRPRLHHLRTWYALADLYERAGEIPRARALFTSVLRHEHDFADVAERLAALG
ncbi:MAG TPA: tetratricopeptide repeat protein [Acidimicrobiales bacterium]|nr:tetratricopeptide repeat protein [Acidimicrobiales bacterium]